MFVGHYAGAFVAKAVEPRWSLATYVIAVQAVDVAWGLLVLAGIERATLDPALSSNALVLSYMPFTHSLPATIVWMLVIGVLGAAWAGGRAGIVLGLAVGSHWVGDLLVHRPDLPIGWTAPKVGLGLWDYAVASWVIEVTLVLGSLWWCGRNGVVLPGRALRRLGLVLVVLETTLRLIPPPPSIHLMAGAGLVAYGAIALAAARLEAATVCARGVTSPAA